jgi:hypothetical protein
VTLLCLLSGFSFPVSSFGANVFGYLEGATNAPAGLPVKFTYAPGMSVYPIYRFQQAITIYTQTNGYFILSNANPGLCYLSPGNGLANIGLNVPNDTNSHNFLDILAVSNSVPSLVPSTYYVATSNGVSVGETASNLTLTGAAALTGQITTFTNAAGPILDLTSGVLGNTLYISTGTGVGGPSIYFSSAASLYEDFLEVNSLGNFALIGDDNNAGSPQIYFEFSSGNIDIVPDLTYGAGRGYLNLWSIVNCSNTVNAAGNIVATGGLASLSTAQHTFAPGGWTNISTNDVRVWGFTGTNFAFSNATSKVHFSLGTVTNQFYVLQPGEALQGTNCTIAGAVDF